MYLLEFLVVKRAQFDDFNTPLVVGLCALSRYGSHVVAEHAKGYLNDRRVVLLSNITHMGMSVVPDEVCGTDQSNKLAK